MMNQDSSTCVPTESAGERLSLRVQSAWRTIRTLVGDDAYERYCAHHVAHHPGEAPLTRRAFYIRDQTEKWSGIKRCC